MKNKLGILGVFLAIGGAAIGLHYRNRIATALVLVGLAVFSAVSGLRMIVTRKADIPTSDSLDPHREYHTGLSAVFWGLLFLVFSLPFGALGVAVWIYGAQPPSGIVEGIARSPLASGLIVVIVGAAIGMYGLTRVLPGKAAFRETGIGRVERGFTAVYLSAVGTFVVAAGLVRILAPGALTRWRDAVIAWALAFAK